jgi:hypothetical protein
VDVPAGSRSAEHDEMRSLRDPRAGPSVELQGVGAAPVAHDWSRGDPSREWGSGHVAVVQLAVAELDRASGFVGGLTERHVRIGPLTKKFARVLTPQLMGVVGTRR